MDIPVAEEVRALFAKTWFKNKIKILLILTDWFDFNENNYKSLIDLLLNWFSQVIMAEDIMAIVAIPVAEVVGIFEINLSY